METELNFWASLMQPDAFASSAYGWAANEAGHVAVGVGLMAVMLPFVARRRAIAVALVGYAAFEAVQAATSGVWIVRDCLNDWMAVAIGAGIAAALWSRKTAALPFLIGAAALGLMRGVRARK